MLRTAAPTRSFLAVIYVIMVKNTITRRLFLRKKRRNRAEARSLIVEKNPAKRFFDNLIAPWRLPGGLSYVVLTYSLGPASTRALPVSLPVYLTKFLMKREARS